MAGQVEVEKVGVCAFQIIHQCRNREMNHCPTVRVLLLADEIGYGEEGAVVHAGLRRHPLSLSPKPSDSPKRLITINKE